MKKTIQLLKRCFGSGKKAIKWSKQENEKWLVGAMFNVDVKQKVNVDQNVWCNWEKKIWLIANMNWMIELNSKQKKKKKNSNT